MLYLTRREGEAVIINNSIEVRVVELRGRAVKLGFNFPNNASVLREEVFELIREENEAAAQAAQSLSPEDLRAEPDAGGLVPDRNAGDEAHAENTEVGEDPEARRR